MKPIANNYRNVGLLGLLWLWQGAAWAGEVLVWIQSAPVAGFHYHGGPALWSALRTGDPLSLHRERDNPHDGQAVRVMWREHTLGYLPRAENPLIAQALDQGQALSARILRLQDHPNPRERVKIGVFFGIPRP